uniref:protein shisa-4 isoform X4 n=1 Tax=Halichoerus grypus TaxID=9711 RepID=UPI001659815B|nr:protein shisa-4 isoform X4 [Halichoerus grypus]
MSAGPRGLPVVPGPERLLASRLQLRVLHLLLRDLLPALLLQRPDLAHHREAAEALPGLQSQDHSRHRLGRDPLRGGGGHHHLLLPVLLLLPVPPAPASAEPVRSSSPLYATTALLPRSLRNQLSLCCPFSDAPLLYLHLALGVGKGPLLSRPQTKPSPGSYW